VAMETRKNRPIQNWKGYKNGFYNNRTGKWILLQFIVGLVLTCKNLRDLAGYFLINIHLKI
jgi:hypothetical protein